MINVDKLNLSEISTALRVGKITSLQLTEHYLERINKYNLKINAIIQLNSIESLIEMANNADLMIRNNQVDWEKKPLWGIPLTIKDVCHVEGFKLSRGVKEFYGQISKSDATVVKRLKLAGAHILGITNVPEMCMAFETDNLIYGRTNNPYDLKRTCGGSSGGEAAAIASGMSPAGLASDACGSVRLPAHFNGVVGLKFTQWSVPLTGQFPVDRSGIFNFTSSFSVMGRYTEDVNLLGHIITGDDGLDPDTIPIKWALKSNKSLSSLNIGVWIDDTIEHQDSIRNAMNQVSNVLKLSVNTIKKVNPPLVQEAFDTIWKLFVLGGTEGRNWYELFEKMNKTEFSFLIESILNQSKSYKATPDEIRNLLIMRDTVRTALKKIFSEIDILICPTYPQVAFEHGMSFENTEYYKYLFLFSLSGQPVLNLPIGKCNITNMPIGMQVVGDWWKEDIILMLGKHIEEVHYNIDGFGDKR